MAGAVVGRLAGTSRTTGGARGEEDADGATRWGFGILHVGTLKHSTVKFKSLGF